MILRATIFQSTFIFMTSFDSLTSQWGRLGSLLFYRWGAEPQSSWLVCPKSPWISIRICVRLWLSFSGSLFLFFFYFKDFIYLFIFREMGREGEREREREKLWCVWDTLTGCLSHAPNQGPGPQPRHVPWLGIELATFWFIGQHSIHWATPARAHMVFLTFSL